MTKICTTKIKDKIIAICCTNSRLFIALSIIIGSIFFINIAPHNACAADLPTCTALGGSGASVTLDGKDAPEFETKPLAIISNIILDIRVRLYGGGGSVPIPSLASIIYNYVKLNVAGAIRAAIVLSIAVYGVLFMTGMIQLKTSDFLIRMVKIGVVAQLLSLDSWFFFNDYVVKFFNDGTDEVITYLTGSGGLLASIPDLSNLVGSMMTGIGPFAAIDAIISKVVSARMFVTIMATFLTYPYGAVYGALLVYSIWVLIQALLSALWVYIMSMVIRTLLLGLAPIFITTILFQRTRHIFDGWINQLVTSMLQPILLFTFFVFFVNLLSGSLDNIMHTPVCFSKFPESLRGSGLDLSFWRFMVHNSNGWEPNSAAWELNKDFPINMMALLTFFIIAELAGRFNDVVLQIAAQISQAQTSLTGVSSPISAMAGSMRESISNVNAKAGGGGGSIKTLTGGT